MRDRCPRISLRSSGLQERGTMTITMRTLALAGALSAATTGHAAELKVVSGNGARAAVQELCRQFERTTGHRIALHFEVNAALQRKIEAGETFDVAILNPPVLDALIKQGKIVGLVPTSAAPGSASRCVRARPSLTSQPSTHSGARCSPRTPSRFRAKARADATS